MTQPASTVLDAPPPFAPFHDGELAAQRRAGVTEAADASGRRGIRTFMPDQHRAFHAQLPFFVVGGVDGGGQPWATLRVGAPGFVSSPEPRTLDIAGGALRDDPLAGSWRVGSLLGGLGIELHTRRRNRINGVVASLAGDAMSVTVGQSFGNCAKYIQSRTSTPAPPQEAAAAAPQRRDTRLDADDRALLARADTFFIASANTAEAAGGARGVDVSHRGGPPGFVRVDDDRTLTTPDYGGNHFFNTIGNLLHDPRAGLLFVDFERGDLLYVAADAEIVWDGPALAAFEGAQRLVRFRIREVRRSAAALPFRWSPAQFAPQFAGRDGLVSAPAVAAALASSALASASTAALASATATATALAVASPPDAGWRALVVAAVCDETPDVRSFYLEAADARPLAPFEPGQHLTIRLPAAGRSSPPIRSYTLSDAFDGRRYRISVKRDGDASSWLHDHASPGVRIDAMAPRGAFTLDAASPRPVVFVSAGIGITPMIAMLDAMLARRAAGAPADAGAKRIHFVHGARRGSERPFAAHLAAAARAHPALSVHLFDSRPDHASCGASPGRVSVDALKRLLPFDSYDFYLCGPTSFMKSLYDGLRALDVPDERIRFEAFGPSSVRRAASRDDAAAASNTGARTATVVFSRSRRTVEWTPRDGTLLELAEARGVPAASNCRSGACGTCAARVLGGRVRHDGAIEADVAPGTALVCMATPDCGGVEGERPCVTLDL
ncbi:pyridoxamine 5'-phosphate oxidase family protein [Burkholderia oklahomensis]|uniref:pyridoxamine 5'-phosphate oxidase family protein n=1 Tax=Burkholderia oklahomensis TaxID=342113 RepID=UPI0002EED2D0|nr:pyridoxamine 5'-phosphate oxidase family protein [Burkholderia oklahomensis]AJX35625.1 2Fe-2S iron-sulfur cluster binding domain protein [Burkholderia oklahomensis C6786]AOI48178.1 pyridoxamine 5'-phosphate oxidase [Burkholderia oklahomensis C6786]KUY49953.1 pyridoxamine 5'-phosphate oxidase [Burkholderia oklahomensis C6786]MBI0363685.1 pyridoxamine 5'-phosphate oxidase family protein [Burkholderia oklahomensis]SUY27813.1 Nitric oxide dioxygenase [Burkholderia oklahomensis]